MRAILSTLVAATLLGHSFADVSRHQQHQCAECSSAAVAPLAASCCRHDQHVGDGDHSPNRPCDCQLDCVGGCSYLPTQKVALNAPHLLAPLVAANLPAISVGCGALPGCWNGSSGPWEGESPSLRRHLALHILLI
jgi:hypothetical protein